MKRKVLMSLLVVTGLTAVIGSGFASWYFGVNDLSAENNIGVYVAPMAENIGSLTASSTKDGDDQSWENLFVIFEQGGYSNLEDTTVGLSIGATNTTEVTEDKFPGPSVKSLDATYSIKGKYFDQLRLAGLKGTFTATLEIPTNAQTYVKFDTEYDGISFSFANNEGKNSATGTYTTKTATKIEYQYVIDFTDTDNVNYGKGNDADTAEDDIYTQKFSIDVSTSDTYKNALLQYNSKPTTKEQYNSMKTALNDGALTVSYKFAVSAKTSAN